MLVLAFDPGESTGAAVVDSGEWPPKVLQTTTIHDVGHLAIFWSFWIKPHGQDDCQAVVFESWRLRPGTALQKTGSEFPEIQVIGQIKLLAYQAGLWDKLIKQEPYAQSGTMFDSTFAQYGTALKLKTTHERSALSHALYYLKGLANQAKQSGRQGPLPLK